MRRVVCRAFGPPDGLVLEEAPDPEPGPGEVLIGVRAAGVTFADGLIVGGSYQVKPPLPSTPGLAVAGDVLGAGEGVPGLPRGSRVAGCWLGLGGYATHRVLPVDAVVPLPDGVSDAVAAGVTGCSAPAAYPLERAAEALNALARRQVTGKLALLP